MPVSSAYIPVTTGLLFCRHRAVFRLLERIWIREQRISQTVFTKAAFIVDALGLIYDGCCMLILLKTVKIHR